MPVWWHTHVPAQPKALAHTAQRPARVMCSYSFCVCTAAICVCRAAICGHVRDWRRSDGGEKSRQQSWRKRRARSRSWRRRPPWASTCRRWPPPRRAHQYGLVGAGVQNYNPQILAAPPAVLSHPVQVKLLLPVQRELVRARHGRLRGGSAKEGKRGDGGEARHGWR
jgi:hypothetical protein